MDEFDKHWNEESSTAKKEALMVIVIIAVINFRFYRYCIFRSSPMKTGQHITLRRELMNMDVKNRQTAADTQAKLTRAIGRKVGSDAVHCPPPKKWWQLF